MDFNLCINFSLLKSVKEICGSKTEGGSSSTLNFHGEFWSLAGSSEYTRSETNRTIVFVTIFNSTEVNLVFLTACITSGKRRHNIKQTETITSVVGAAGKRLYRWPKWDNLTFTIGKLLTRDLIQLPEFSRVVILGKNWSSE